MLSTRLIKAVQRGCEHTSIKRIGFIHLTKKFGDFFEVEKSGKVDAHVVPAWAYSHNLFSRVRQNLFDRFGEMSALFVFRYGRQGYMQATERI